MATFKRFEDIQAWQKARETTNRIYRLSNRGEFSRDFSLRDQMKRAAISIMANIAEGHGRRSRLEFANFLNVARGSAVELQSHLYVALDLDYITEAEFNENYQQLDEISKMTVTLAKYLRSDQ